MDTGGRAGVRIFTGTIPDYATDVKGLLLGGVIGGGPAEQAGLQKGDVIIEIAGQTIANIYDYTYALEVLKSGPAGEGRLHARRRAAGDHADAGGAKVRRQAPVRRSVAIDDFALGAGKMVDVSGRHVALFRLEDGFYAIDNLCLHHAGPLCEGVIDGRRRDLSVARLVVRDPDGHAGAGPRVGVSQHDVTNRGRATSRFDWPINPQRRAGSATKSLTDGDGILEDSAMGSSDFFGRNILMSRLLSLLVVFALLLGTSIRAERRRRLGP